MILLVANLAKLNIQAVTAVQYCQLHVTILGLSEQSISYRVMRLTFIIVNKLLCF